MIFMVYYIWCKECIEIVVLNYVYEMICENFIKIILFIFFI